MMQSCPISTVAQLDRWVVDCMKVYIIFAHELEQTDVLRVEPPLFPFGGVVGRDAHVPNWGVKLKASQVSSINGQNDTQKYSPTHLYQVTCQLKGPRRMRN
jgi:hypothetical protein